MSWTGGAPDFNLPPLPDTAEMYMGYLALEKGYSSATVRGYACDLAQFEDFFAAAGHVSGYACGHSAPYYP